MLASVVWLAVAADVLSPGPFGRYSHFPKGNDFLQFYVAGTLVRAGAFHALVDDRSFREAQSPYLPQSAHASFPPVYGPQIGLLFAPLARFSYVTAFAIWSAISILLTGVAISVFWTHCPSLRPWPWAIIAAAAAFPPMGYLILDGQLSALGAFALGVLVIALERRSRVLAGIALGLLGYKLSLFIPALAVCVLAGEIVVSGVAASVAAMQLLGVTPMMGIGVVRGFIANTLTAIRVPDALAVRPYLMGSLRTFWMALLPELAARMAYGATAFAAVAAAAWGWRDTQDPLRRVALLSIAVALAAPHLFLYDLIIVGPAFIASAGILVNHRDPPLRRCVYAAFLVPLAAPLTVVIHVQLVTIALAAWLVTLLIAGRRLEPSCDLAQPSTDGR